jgi:hypothetical protein
LLFYIYFELTLRLLCILPEINKIFLQMIFARFISPPARAQAAALVQHGGRRGLLAGIRILRRQVSRPCGPPFWGTRG